MSCFRNLVKAVAAAAVMATGLAAAQAADDYPSKEIRWIIPWNPGGSNDIMARYLQPILEQQGFKTVIENIPGGTGAVGMGQVATAKPDGYTIGNGTSSTLAIIAQDKAPLENENFTHIIRLSVDPLMLVVPGNGKHDTLDKFINHMKQNPGKVTIGTPGTNNLNHIFAAMTARGAGVEYRHVPYPGGSRVVAELMGNQIEAGVLKPSETLEQIKAGDLKALGVYGKKRLEVLPDVPTFAEKDIDVFPFGPVVQMGYIEAPAGLDPKVREKLTQAFKTALTSAKFQDFAKKRGFVVDPISGAELEKEVEGVAGAIKQVADKTFKKN